MKQTFTTTLLPTSENWIKTTTSYPVRIPQIDGAGFSEEIHVEIEVWKNEDGELFIPGDISQKLEDLKARHMGLMSPEDIRNLRANFGVTQKEISKLLQIGEKTWTRWETGRERPSRSMNVLLKALHDGKIDIRYLKCMQKPATQLEPIRELSEEERSHKMTFESDLQESTREEMVSA